MWNFNHAGSDLRIYNSGGAGYDILLGVNSGGAVINNKVGIATATPEEKLHVVGNAKISGSVGIGSSAPSTSKLAVDGTIQTKVFAIGSLPSASPAGQRAMVNNSYYTFGSSVIGQTVYAGGSAVAPVYSDGSYWRYG